MNIITNTDNLVEGKWYAVGVKGEDDTINWGGMPIYLYDGNGCWSNEYNESVEHTWDPVLQQHISVNSADAFMEQS